MKIRIILLTAISMMALIILAGCTSQEASPVPTDLPAATSVPVTAAVMGYAERLNAGDLEGTMAYFNDDAIFYVIGMPPSGAEILAGKDQIQTMLAENIASHFKMEIEVLSAVDDVVTTHTTTWHDFTREIGAAPLEATEVYVIEDGKIATEAWHITGDSLARLKPALADAMPEEPEPTSLPETPVSELTVTIVEGTCTYDGPLALQAGPISITVAALDQNKDKFALALFNLEPEKDMADLMASTIHEAPPPWSKILFIREMSPGETVQYETTIEKGPVYGICFSKPPDLAIGSIGPFIVSE